MQKRLCALNTGSDFHLLDHIAPLAHILSMPLITTEEENYRLALKYYPFVDVRYIPHLESSLRYLAEEFDVLFECKYFAPHLKALFYDLYQKEMELIFCPHGYSDKGAKAPLLAPYSAQDGVLLYGDSHIAMLQRLSIWPLKKYAITGNYRRLVYEKHKPFYDELAEKEVFSHFAKKQKTLLYAPTWNDADQATSFFDFAEWVFGNIPSDWNLVVKVHPLLEMRDPARYYYLAAKTERKENICLVSHFPPVFPLLARADAFLGDFSSVGYDYLFFQRPMFFLPDEKLPAGELRRCGTVLDGKTPLSSYLNAAPSCQREQQALFQGAFAPISSLDEMKRSVFSLFSTA